jgi:glycerophosphoryl diester phosphodiesterase
MTPLLLAAFLLASEPRARGTAGGFPFFEPVGPTRSVQVVAHRGAMRQAPENSASAIERSIADTVEWVAVDLRLTRDGHHVLVHDADLGRTTDGAGPVRDRTLAEIRALDAGSEFARRFAGERVLSLGEAMKLARGRINLLLDCKDVDPERLAREVIAEGMERQVVVYDSSEGLRAVRAAAGGETLALMTKWRPRFGFVPWLDEVRPDVVEVDAADVSAEVCREFHRRSVKVLARTLGDDDRPEVWNRVAEAGVDWVRTDLAEEVLARNALKSIQRGAVRVKVAHHRGASRYAPENTLPALGKAIRLGADFVEFDVHTTRDGSFVLLHDGRLDRTTTGRGPVRDRTEAEVRALDAGAWFGKPFVGTKVPGLAEFLAAAGDRVELYVDAKDIRPEALAEVLRRHGLTDRAVVYQGVAYLERLRAVAPALRRMPPLGDPSRIDAIAERVKPYAFDTRWSILSKELIDRCHARGIKVFSDAIGANETVERYQRAILDGIDLIQTDHPVRVLRAVELLSQTR